MKRARFTEDQIIGVLKEHEAGAKTADLARKHGVSEATLYNWKAKYGGMDISEAKRLKQLEDENAKLKKLLAEQMLDAAALRELPVKKMVGPAVKREGVAHLRATMGPVGTAGLLDRQRPARKMVRYRLCRPPDMELRTQLRVQPQEGGHRIIVGCSSCCGRRASPRHQPHLPALARRRPDGAQATGSEARRGVAGADPGRIQVERSLVGGFRP